jgi:hypothetical protein
MGDLISRGSYGEVYDIVDIEDVSTPLVVKIVSNVCEFGREIAVIQ